MSNAATPRVKTKAKAPFVGRSQRGTKAPPVKTRTHAELVAEVERKGDEGVLGTDVMVLVKLYRSSELTTTAQREVIVAHSKTVRELAEKLSKARLRATKLRDAKSDHAWTNEELHQLTELCKILEVPPQ